jgi:hypothetical protein
MYYQLQIVNKFGWGKTIPILKDNDDIERQDEMAVQEAKSIVDKQNKSSVIVKRATLYRLEHIWSANFKADPDY